MGKHIKDIRDAIDAIDIIDTVAIATLFFILPPCYINTINSFLHLTYVLFGTFYIL